MSEPTPGAMRATPYYCPYCGEQDLRPTAQERTWHCRTCERLWTLEFKRIGNPDAAPVRKVQAADDGG